MKRRPLPMVSREPTWSIADASWLGSRALQPTLHPFGVPLPLRVRGFRRIQRLGHQA